MAVVLVVDERPALCGCRWSRAHTSHVILPPPMRGMLRIAFVIALIRGPQSMAFQLQTSRELLHGIPDHHSLRVTTSLANSKSLDSSMNKNIKDLETLQRERVPAGSKTPNRQNPLSLSSNRPPSKIISTPRGSNYSSWNQPKPRWLMRIKSIRSKKVGELSPSDLRSLCNAIQYNREESSLCNLETLERILLEFQFMHENVHNDFGDTLEKRAGYLKRIHVFSMLTALSNEVRSWKRNDQHRRNGKKTGSRLTMRKKDVQRLVKVVTLLSELRLSRFIDSECFNKDVPSFATMIASEASRYEASAIEAAFLFLGMVEKEDIDGNEGWDPRLIGAVLDALARYGRADEAQDLLGRAMGVKISSVGDTISNTVETRALGTFPRKRLASSHAGPCYDALIRSWSKRAIILATDDETDKSKISDSFDQVRQILFHEMPELNITITNKTVNAVLHGYSALGMGFESEKVLMEIETINSFSLSGNAPPRMSILDVGCYNTVLQGCCHRPDGNNFMCAERIFSAMKKRRPLNISMMNLTSTTFIPPEPDYISYSTMINCYCDHGMAIKAEDLLDEMCKSTSFKPTISCFLPIVQALEMSRELDVPQRVISLLERSNESLKKPSRSLYLAALNCLKQHGCGEEAEIIFAKFRNSHTDHAHPDMYAHMLVLRAWEKTAPKSERSTASMRAEKWFHGMQELVNASLLPAMDVNAYNHLLNCYARAGDAEKAEQLLSKMESSSEDSCILPTSKSYSLVIKALSNSDLSDEVNRAWKILIRSGLPNGMTTASPLEQVKIYNSMLRLFAKRGMASEAEALLNTMDEIVNGSVKAGGPDIQSFEAVLEALGRCGDADAPSRAEALVTRLEVMSELGGCSQPSLLAYNSLLNCYANAGMAGRAERILERLNDADSYSYGSTIKALANSGKAQVVAIARAESLSNAIGVGNEVVFTHRLKLCQKWGLGNEAEKLIRQMEEQKLKPSVIHYTAALNAWAKSLDNDALKRAEDLFIVMGDQCELDRAAFHGLLLNYSRRGMPFEAQQLLRRMLKSPNLTPNRASFTMVIDSYARAHSNDAGQHAEGLLDQMRTMHAAGHGEVEPDNVTYASVVKCKLISKNVNINTLSKLEKLQMMKELQIESWPF